MLDRPISVLVPARAAAGFLPELMDSFADQARPFEMLCCADGCPDTLRALGKQRRGWLRLFRSRQCVGPYVLFNTLVQHASHPLLLFFGADDLALPGMLARVAEALACADIAGLRLTQAGSRTWDRRNNMDAAATTKRALGAFGIRRTAFDKMGGFMPWRCTADREFRRRAERSGPTTVWLVGAAFIQRKHPGQISRNLDLSGERRRHHAWLAGPGSRAGHIRPVCAPVEELA